MELRHLRYFVAVAELENVSRAASKLHVSQPALSRQIRNLEQELGFALLERSARSVRVTEAGRTFLLEARAVLERVDQAVKAARSVATGGQAELNVGYAPSPTVRILPPTLRAFQSALPKVRVRLHDLSTEEMLAGLRDGKLQVALMVRPTPGMLRGLQFAEIARERMCVALSRKHSLARARELSVPDVAGEPLIVFSRKEYPEYHELLARLFASIRKKPRIMEEHDSVASLIAAVEAGCGVALAPQSLACMTGTRLKLVPLSPAPEPLIIGVAWRRQASNPLAEQFANIARMAARSAGN